MPDHIEEMSKVLEGLGLDPIGFTRSEEFHVEAATIGSETIRRIEELMDSEMSDELKDLIYMVVERSAHLTGPHLVFEP